MPITKFKITRAPIRATIEIEAVPFVLNQEYPIAKQSQMVAKVTGVGVPYDSFGFKLGNNNNVWSAEYNCKINANVGAGLPVNSNIDIDIKLNEITDLTPLFVFDSNTDRIRFTDSSSSPYGAITINGSPMQLNKTYYLYEFINVKWVSAYFGTLQNVLATRTFQVGNKNSWSPNYNINLQSTANLMGTAEMNGINLGDDDISPVNVTGTLTNNT